MTDKSFIARPAGWLKGARRPIHISLSLGRGEGEGSVIARGAAPWQSPCDPLPSTGRSLRFSRNDIIDERVLALAEKRMVILWRKKIFFDKCPGSSRAPSRTQRERQERERIEQAATPAITPMQIKPKIGSSRKTRKGRRKPAHR